ncbi:type II toxin-antitoxin system RelE/ParE family toxin [Pseudomonas frederiksbergensis]|uniref:type II toxin-antitoxin system RelE/ParE family toxin n=1 Tax=Pseudomonas frederiksbergensis TaxID=104087 RepID=UPI00198089A8|nr:type II toxin-antitoxin system RelE/ParE family toxin [Pseudomonas frederiksbergensis]MBN3862180.1 type II toxin-antitoxin system RelE/ParE family toxin [Pseudomonas frederiksbergensis]
MPPRISNAARADIVDIVDILRLSQTQFGDQARQRYQALILAALQAIADTPSHDRDELAPGLRSYHLIYSRQQAKHPPGTVKSSRYIVFYRVANDDVIEVVRLLHDAMEVQLHLPND